jgi:hypothetical protein
MQPLSNGKDAIRRLVSLWQTIVAQSGSTREIGYRMEKLISRLDVVVDKMFTKTVKAHEMLRDCLTLTEQFQAERIHSSGEKALVLLTRLESCVDDLVRKTHEFRVKAG